MNNQQVTSLSKEFGPWIVGTVVTVLIVGALFIWWTVAQVDREMRADLLKQARLVTQAINFKNLQALSGTMEDLESPSYQRLKEQLAAVRLANPQCRFFYLMGRKVDGTVFFFLDSEPADSKEYSPPGQVYTEVPTSYRRVFDTKDGAVLGPDIDRWGTWVSALVPIINPQTGTVLGVLGMDIDANAWKWNVATRAALPVGIMLVLLISVVAIFFVTLRINASPKPVLRRLLPSLAVIVILLIVGTGAILYRQHQQRLARDFATVISDISDNLRIVIDLQASGLAATMQPIAADPGVQKALCKGDSDSLLATWLPVFETLRRENLLTHFYFFDENRVCLLRVHKPEIRGDRIERFTAREAERTGKIASGIELGPLGTFTLRVVLPIFANSRLAGYVELGMEIKDVLKALHTRPGDQLAVVIRKEHLNQRAWEEGMRLLNREADWNRLPRITVIYASQGHLPDALASWFDQLPDNHNYGKMDREISADGRDWQVSATPFLDASGKEVGDLLIMHDITIDKAAFSDLTTLGGTAGVVLLALLLSFIYVLLYRTDASIRIQQVALRESEQSYRNQFANNSAVMLLFDPVDGTIIDANAVALVFYGYPRERFLAMRISDINIMPAFELHQVMASVQSGQGQQFESQHRLADGTLRDVAVSLSRIQFGDRIVLHSIIQNITERKSAEDALRASRKQLNDIIDFLPDATFAINMEGHVLIWNKAMERMTQLPAMEMIGKGDYSYAIPFYGEARPQLIDLIFEDKNKILFLYPHLTHEGETLSTEVFCEALYHKEGAWVFAKASPLRDQSGNVIGAIESIRDITKSKQTEEKLQKSLVWFKALFNATSDSVILHEPNGMILDLNDNAARRRNLAKSSMRGQNLFDFLPPSAVTTRRNAINRLLNEKRLVQYDETRNDKHYRIRLYPVKDEQGTVIQVASFSHDITEYVQAEEDRKKLQSQLIQSQKMEAIGTLAGGIAHDFNNILGVILGYTEMARGKISSTEGVTKCLDKVEEAGKRAVNLVKQILTFSRQTETRRIFLKPALIVKEAVDFLRPSLPSTITIKQQIDITTSPIFADPTQIHQILINLCSNAFHAMEKTGGTLEITLKCCELSWQDLQPHPGIQPGKYVLLSIGDTGQGIEPEIQGNIFEPYFTTKGIGKGTGMGLSIVHGIVTSYKGFITCESELGKGTIFHIYFPAASQEVTSEAKQIEEVPLGREHILFVDDEELLAELYSEMLELLGYEVTARTSSLDALNTFQNEPERFDIVITDLTMPGMTGTDLAKRIMQIRPGLPIILCTGYSSLISEEKARGSGIKAFAEKPLGIKDLSVLIRKVLDESKLPE